MGKLIDENSKKWAFIRGWSQVPTSRIKKVRKELYEAIGIKSRTGFCKHLNGTTKHSVQQAENIVKVFNSVGITEVWGDKPFYDDEKES